MSFASMMTRREILIDAVAAKIGQDVSHDLAADEIGDNFAASVDEVFAEVTEESEESDGSENIGPFVVNEPAEPAAAWATFTAPRKALAEALKLVSSAVPRYANKSALQAVRLSINGTVEFQATDMEQSAELHADFERRGEATILVAPARLSQALRNIKAPEVCCTIEGENIIVSTSAGQAMTIPCFDDPAEFPSAGWKFDQADILADFHIDGQRFAEGINRTAFAIDPDSTRYALGGVLLECSESACYLAATDSRRMSVHFCGAPDGFRADDSELKPVGHEKFAQYVIPPATLNRVAAAIAKRDGLSHTLRVVIHNSIPVYCDAPRPGVDSNGQPTEEKTAPTPPTACQQITFIVPTADGSQYFTTVPVQGRFPDYRKIIPASFNTSVILPRDELLQALKLAQTVTNEERRGVDFAFSGNGLVKIDASSECGKISETVRGEIGTFIDETALLTCFDPRYIVEFLTALPKRSRVCWRLINNNSAAVIRTMDDNTDYVIMPLSRAD